MTFHKICDNTLNLHYGWMLRIKSIEDVLCFIEHFQIPEMKIVVGEILKKIDKPQNHMCHRLASIIVECAGPYTSYAESMEKIFGSQIKNMIRLIQEDGCYVSQNLGIVPAKGMQVLDTCESDAFPPDENLRIKIIKWPFGTHYYAKYGKKNIQEDDKTKWNTFDLACNAAKRWYRSAYKRDYNLDFESE